MDLRNFEAGAAGSAPTPLGSPSVGYPTNGDPQTAVPPTTPGEYWYHQVAQELRQVILDASLTPDDANLAQLSAAIKALARAQTSRAIVVDEKAAGTDGGTFTLGAWRTRTLNTVRFDPNSIVSLASNQITLQPGSYIVRASAPAMNVNQHKARLYNVTDASVVGFGSSANTTAVGNADGLNSESVVVCGFTIASAKAFRLEHYSQQTQVDFGFGFGFDGFGTVETFSVVEITKFA